MNLGACGSHLVEHFFGMLSRLTHNNETMENVLKVAKNAMVIKGVLSNSGVTLESNKRISDSGVVLSGSDNEFNSLTLSEVLSIAQGLFLESGATRTLRGVIPATTYTLKTVLNILPQTKKKTNITLAQEGLGTSKNSTQKKRILQNAGVTRDKRKEQN